jgi:hypothetical protein
MIGLQATAVRRPLGSQVPGPSKTAIQAVNRTLTGWANYFRHGVSKAVFSAAGGPGRTGVGMAGAPLVTPFSAWSG